MPQPSLNSQALLKFSGILIVLGYSQFNITVSYAQVVPDASLGRESSVVVPNQFVNSTPSISIQGGAIRGKNLFHSFQEFNIPTGRGVYFISPSGTVNILTRVTGNNSSNISGVLGVLGKGNLFFLNPNGIIFSRNARLDLKGSFLATTADSFGFQDGSVFSAKNPQSVSPLLTGNLPTTLHFSGNSGVLAVRGTGHNFIQPSNLLEPIVSVGTEFGLSVPTGQTLALIGGEVNFVGGIARVESGQLEVGSVAKGQVNLADFDYSKVQKFSNIYLIDRALLDGSGSSRINLTGENISLAERSLVNSENLTGEEGGLIQIQAQKIFKISGQTRPLPANSGILSYASGLNSQTFFGKGADISIKSGDLVLQDQGVISLVTYGSGNSGNLKVETQNSVSVLESSPTLTSYGSAVFSLTVSSGNAGNIFVKTGNLTVKDGGLFFSSTASQGNAGKLDFNTVAIDVVGVNRANFLPSLVSTATGGSGNAGDIILNTKFLRVLGGGRIDSSTLADGSAGNITINALDSISLASQEPGSLSPSQINSSASDLHPIFSQLLKFPIITGSSGSVKINTNRLTLAENAEIRVTNDGTGNAGTLSINAPQIFLTSGGSITAATASGNGGEITINSSDLRLDAASITATAGNMGNGGNIDINTDALVLDNSSINANAFSGNGGNIGINTAIFLQRDSEVTASSEFGLDGNVQINQLNLPNSLFSTPSSISPQTQVTLAIPCADRKFEFYLTGKPGLPLPPSDLEFAETQSIHKGREANVMVHHVDGSISLGYSHSLAMCEKPSSIKSQE
jgi:filamentous hemagglutinin family protein